MEYHNDASLAFACKLVDAGAISRKRRPCEALKAPNGGQFASTMVTYLKWKCINCARVAVQGPGEARGKDGVVLPHAPALLRTPCESKSARKGMKVMTMGTVRVLLAATGDKVELKMKMKHNLKQASTASATRVATAVTSSLSC